MMADVTPIKSRLSVNAAFLRDIKDDNRDLKIVIERIERLIATDQSAAHHWRELLRLWADLRDQLAMHFGLEEAYGYFDLVDEADAELTVAAGRLKSEHAELFESIRHLAEAAPRACVGDASVEGAVPEVTTAQEKILHRFTDFLRHFKTHEEAELKLILDALDEDLGGGD